MPSDDSSTIERLDPAAVEALLGGAGVHIIDVRMPFDFFGGRVPGALNLPGDSIVERSVRIPEDMRVVFVCDDGEQSGEVAAAAQAAGWSNVAVLEGGMNAWFDADLPVETISDGNSQI